MKKYTTSLLILFSLAVTGCNSNKKDKQITSLTIKGDLEKTAYVVGEQWDNTGLSVEALYSDSSTSVLDSCTFEYNPAKPAKGVYSVSITASNGKIKSNPVKYSVSVTETYVAVSSFNIVDSSKTINVGNTQNLTYSVLPENATNKKVIWTSDDEKVATVTNGVVKGISEGQTIVRGTTNDGNYSDYCTINVEKGEDFDGYYNSITASEGTALLSELVSLNKSKRKSTVGYSAMGTNPSGKFKFTDYDPNSEIKYENGVPYGSKILSFYSGVSCTSWNREHVWPDSRGGGSVDNDIYMPRPTVPAENSNRGNSCYVEGMCHSANGWDPVQAFDVVEPSVGTYEGIRGECARIIFYCMTANSNLKLVDNADSSSKSLRYTKLTMGKLSDMLKWCQNYPVNEREKRRQVGGQYLQGNRNAFVDHPEYACKIWGNTNSETRKACGLN